MSPSEWPLFWRSEIKSTWWMASHHHLADFLVSSNLFRRMPRLLRLPKRCFCLIWIWISKMCSYPVLHISHMCMDLFYIHIKLYIYIFIYLYIYIYIYICVCMLYKLYPYNYVRLLQSIQDILVHLHWSHLELGTEEILGKFHVNLQM